MDYTVYQERDAGKPHRDQGGDRGVRRQAGQGEGIRVCHKLGIRRRRRLKLFKDLAEIELVLSMLYICTVALSALEPAIEDLIEKIPQLAAGGVALAVGAVAWITIDRIEKHLKKRIKK